MTRSAGILLFRTSGDVLQVLIGHPGGPFWKNKSEGAWSIPKGLVEPGEDPLLAAQREFAEETGHRADVTQTFPLGSTTLSSGKEVMVWGVRGDLDPAVADSNNVAMEWPRGTGRTIEFPEIDEVRWCPLGEARRLLNAAQQVFLDRLQELLDHPE